MSTTEPRVRSFDLSHEVIKRQVERLAYQQCIDLKNIPPMELHFVYDEAAHHMIATLLSRIATKKFAVKTVKYPATWLDAFKERFVPERWKHLCKIEFVEVTLEANAYHPDLRLPDHQTFVEIHMMAKRRMWATA